MSEENATVEPAFEIKNLDTPSIGQLWNKGILFSIESYQRGYRWKQPQVWRLLEDIRVAAEDTGPRKSYMLQPVVLREQGSAKGTDGRTKHKFELIDGQQRLTCLWIIIQYLRKAGVAEGVEVYDLDYATRPGSTKFLHNLANGIIGAPTSIDEERFVETYDCVNDFFQKHTQKYRWFEYLQEHVSVIWYVAEEALQAKTAEDIFMSLNHGRIPLTDSELVKTLLLVRCTYRDILTNKVSSPEIQKEIATQWDEMEHHLADEDFWAFLAGDTKMDEKPRMDYLLGVLPPPNGGAWKDLIGDDYKVFNRYSDLIDANKARLKYVHEVLWRRHIRAGYLKLSSWEKNTSLYHKIGFLVAVQNFDFLSKDQNEGNSGREGLLRELLALDCPKWKLEEHVNEKIREVSEKIGDWDSLNYKKTPKKLEALLLLFNVATCLSEARKSGSRMTERYSFARHFDSEHPWSLEHINPQKEMRTLTNKAKETKSDWYDWIKTHAKYLDTVRDGAASAEFIALKNAVSDAVAGGEERMTETLFRDLYGRIVSLFNAGFDEDKEDLLGNMALLRQNHNSSIGANAFVVKRRKITEFVSNGEFVPLCTRRVFLKYYLEDQDNGGQSAKTERPEGNTGKYSFAFWTNDDAEGYVKRMKNLLNELDLLSKNP